MNTTRSDVPTKALWATAGGLLLAYVVLTFAGVAFQQSRLLGDSPSKTTEALIQSSLTKNLTGGTIEFFATLLFLVGALLIAVLVRSDGDVGTWLSSCATAGVVASVAVTIAAGFAAGAAALYDGHHGATLETVTAVNDIRNFSFFLSGGLMGIFVLAVSAAGRLTARLPRWICNTGFVVGALYVVTIPAARTGVINVATLLGFVWLAALGVTALRLARRPVERTTLSPEMAATS